MRNPQSVLLHFLFGAVLVGAYALVEELLWAGLSGGPSPLLAARTACAALIGGLGLSLVGALADFFCRMELGGKVGAVLTVGSLAIAIVSAVRVGDSNAILAIVAVLGLAALVARRLNPSRESVLDAFALIGPYVVTGVVVAFVAAWVEYAPDRAHRAEGLVRLLMLAWTAAIIGAFFYAMLGARRRYAALTLLLPIVGLATISWMPTWFFGLMVALKLAALTYVALVIGLLAQSATAPPRALNVTAAAVAIAGATGIGALMTVDVPSRFGPLDTYSLMGMVLAPTCVDADGDTFFGGDGGTDPDDTDADVKPTDRLLGSAPLPAGGAAVRAEHAIVLIADAMRADATYGLEDAFLNTDGGFVRFTRAYALSNTTNVSVPALLDGSAPGPPGSPRDPLFAALPDVERHFAVLTDLEQPWRPARFSVAPDQFSHSSDADAERSYAPLALKWLKSRHHAGTSRVLSVAYLSDPHAPYICKGGAEGGYDCYLDELRRVDGLVRDLVEHLRTAQLLDQTLLIVTADHGEEFGEHGFDNHSTNLFEVQIHVPLYLRAPGVTGRDVAVPISNAGTAATVREVFGAAPPLRGYPSLLALATGASTTYPVPVAHHWEDEHHDIRVAIRKSAFVETDAKLLVDWRTGHTNVVDPTNADAPLDAPEIRRRHLGERWP